MTADERKRGAFHKQEIRAREPLRGRRYCIASKPRIYATDHTTMRIDISVILVSYNTAGLLGKCLSALRAALDGFVHEIVIVDNASRDGSVELIKTDHPDCRLIENRCNVGFARANNQALKLIHGGHLLLLNTDAFVERDTLHKSVAYLNDNQDCGLLGVRLVGQDGTPQPSARFFPTPLNLFLRSSGLDSIFTRVRMVDDAAWDQAAVRHCDWVPGCFCLIRREVVDQLGLFDARYFLYYEEVDLCFAAKKAGWKVACIPGTTVVHLGGESAKSEGTVTPVGRQLEAMQIESELLYFRKNHGILTALVDVVLVSMADIVVVLKRTIKGKKPIGATDAGRRAYLVWSLLWRTQWATKPTR
jgi:N-acetylglucosaminyl-diphospho-decaprenol L-rhamnosyltransferase